MTKCKICGDPIKKCPRRGTNNWCHTWHHEHVPKPKNNIPQIILIVSIILMLSFLVFNTSIKNDIEQSIQKYTQSNNETNLKNESEYYDCPSDPKSGSLSPEAYRKIGQIPPQCKKENSQPIQTVNDNNRIVPPELSIIDKIKIKLSSLSLDIPKSQPCIQTTSQNGGFIGTISQGDCSKLQLSGLSPDEQKLVGTWKFIGATGSYMKFTFKDDRNFILETDTFGKTFGTYSVSGNQINLAGKDGLGAGIPTSIPYRFEDNNNLVLTIAFGIPLNFEKQSWW